MSSNDCDDGLKVDAMFAIRYRFAASYVNIGQNLSKLSETFGKLSKLLIALRTPLSLLCDGTRKA